MPCYDYECTECSHSFSTFEKMLDEPQTVCPECGKFTRRVILSPPVCIVSNIITVGQLADKNWSKMGHYEKQEKCEEDGVNKSTRSYQEKKLINKLASLDEKQKEKYILKGELD